jgi:probable addiction module antidote protein
MASYLEASLEEAQEDDAFIAKALGDIARARGMSQVARDAGLSREGGYPFSSTTPYILWFLPRSPVTISW